MRVKLTEERRNQLVGEIITLFRNQFDRELSVYQAEGVVDHLVKRVGPVVYNQAIQDARAFMQGKLEDLEIEVYVEEEDA